jgi:integrase
LEVSVKPSLPQTGLRASELIGLTCGDLRLGTGAHITCLGKGRICRIRHSRPYVATGTMLRRRFS